MAFMAVVSFVPVSRNIDGGFPTNLYSLIPRPHYWPASTTINIDSRADDSAVEFGGKNWREN